MPWLIPVCASEESSISPNDAVSVAFGFKTLKNCEVVFIDFSFAFNSIYPHIPSLSFT